jgi:uncharacterized membrane-anchored protein
MKSSLQILTLAFPILFMLGMIGLHTYSQSKAEEWRIPIEGYDPRDLLRGHYLRYQYVWNWKNEKDDGCSGEKCALCFESDNKKVQTSRYNPVVHLKPLIEAKEKCDTYVKGFSDGRKFGKFKIGSPRSVGLTQYFIPEQDAYRLDRMLRRWSEDADKHEFDMGLYISKNGRASIKTIYIDGTPLETWIAQNPAESAK